MAPITPFMSEMIYQNLRNGLAEDSELNKQSIHFTRIPEYSEDLICALTEARVTRMQSAIETGRKLRDKVKLPMKYPLQKVKLIEANPEIAEGLLQLS
jgi:isoleucyl-tRNA synthetase